MVENLDLLDNPYNSPFNEIAMTMSASQSEVEYLASTLIKNEQPVTYQSLSRELGVHVNHAKLVLSEFYEKNKDKLTASFVITGRNSNRTLIKLSRNEETLENDVAPVSYTHLDVYKRQ